MREMVLRGRCEKVAFFEGIVQIIAQLTNANPRIFGKAVNDYSEAVFQEVYDADMLRQKKDALIRARTRIRRTRTENTRQISRLEKMGQYYDKVMGPLPFDKKKEPEQQVLRPLKKDPAK